MCLTRRKLLLYDYFIGKMVEWQKEDTKDLSKDYNAYLQKFGSIRLMKLLYFTCLESVILKEDTCGNSSLDASLFDLFNRMERYPNGPVEGDLYANKANLIRFSYHDIDGTVKLYENNQWRDYLAFNYPRLKKDEFEQQQKKENVIISLINGENSKDGKGCNLEYYKNLLDNSITNLKERWKYLNLFNDTKKMIQMTHDLVLWKKADKLYNRLSIDIPEDLNSEVEAYKDIFSTVPA